MLNKCSSFLFSLLIIIPTSIFSADEEENRGGIEEITVTAEKRTSTVSDTSMSITAFDASLLEDLGMQGANDLMDQLPATTRDTYDVRIRGVGRNFRALGGDPGVATYYNGIYSPDFGIAASENYLYDVERIEVLRGPQGTLYGRNSIGGAINYITKKPAFESEGEVRTVIGDYGLEQYFLMSSAPLTDDIAYRFTGITVDRDGVQKSIGSGPDTNSLNDENLTFTLLWNINDDMSFQVRANDRLSDRIIGNNVLLTEGYADNRGQRNTTDPVYGLRAATATTPGAVAFTNPITGVVGYGAPLRAGVDQSGFPWRLNPAYGSTGPDVIGTYDVNVNDDSNCNNFPYGPPGCAANHVMFEQEGLQSKFVWDLNDRTTITYMYGSVDFNYTFNYDLDNINSDFSQYRTTVLEDVHMTTHEINVNWMIGDNIEMTSGLFIMDENRQQNYTLSNNVPNILQAANYGVLDSSLAFIGVPASIMGFLGWPSDDVSPHVRVGQAPSGTTITGRWQGDPLGSVYNHVNENQTDAVAYFTQGTWQINDTWALTLGARYAEDEKEALEKRGGYAELYASALGAYLPYANLLTGNPFIPVGADSTIEAQTNVAMGNATWNYNPTTLAQLTALAEAGLLDPAAIYPGSIDPAQPITPTCDITATTCATPLRVGQGIPYSYTSTIGGENSWDDTNVRINLDYEPNENQLWYFSFTTGFRAGGFALGVSGQRDDARDANGVPNGTGSVLVDYDEETVEAIEIGYKGLHLDDTLQIFASVYQYDYDGYQDELEQFDPIRGAGANFVSNANGISNEGFEIEMQYQANDRLNIAGNYSYTKTEYGEDYFVLTVDDPLNPVAVFGQCTQGYVSCDDDDPSFVTDYTVNLKGGPLKGIPETKFTINISYEMDTRVGPVWLFASHSYTGDFSASGVQRALDRIESRETTNVSASWFSDDGSVNVRAYIRNLMDNDMYYALGASSAEQNYRKTVSALDPRTMGIDIRYKF
jgi:outer membrane receptor protein involved in Fe transport